MKELWKNLPEICMYVLLYKYPKPLQQIRDRAYVFVTRDRNYMRFKYKIRCPLVCKLSSLNWMAFILIPTTFLLHFNHFPKSTPLH